MNFLRHAFCVFLVTTCVVYAQRSNEPELDDYVPTVEDDLVIYVPKFSVRLGFRDLMGAGIGFTGQGVNTSQNLLGPEHGVGTRIYHDGAVGPDQRTTVDPAGNTVPITPDGLTNNWNFKSSDQLTDDGLIRMNAYRATVTDSSVHENDPGSALGVELALEREIGSLFGTRLKWGVIAGFSVNQFMSAAKAQVAATIEKTTDYYSLEGQAAPEPPYQGPDVIAGVDTTVLLRADPLIRVSETTDSTTAVEQSWKLRGAYLTFRAGPTLLMPISEKFSASFSAGAVLVYAGSSYEVAQTFRPETGDEIGLDPTQPLLSGSTAKLLPGFYVDANLQYALTDTAGFYFGGVYQSSGDYDQEVETADGLSKYAARVDLSKLQGIRAGMTFKF
jgi:hypothetical protein